MLIRIISANMFWSKIHVESCVGYLKKYSRKTVLLGKSVFKRDSCLSVRNTLKPQGMST